MPAGNGGTDNVLFNDGTKLHSGPLVQGNFNGAGDTGFVIDFTPTSGTGLLAGSGGQATLTGGVGNNPFSDVTAQLENGVTFTNAILNINSNLTGNVLVYRQLHHGSGFPLYLTAGREREWTELLPH
jgi:hypothetical protein